MKCKKFSPFILRRPGYITETTQSQCLNNASKDGYCGHHHPDAIMKREKRKVITAQIKAEKIAEKEQEDAIQLLQIRGFKVTKILE